MIEDGRRVWKQYADIEMDSDEFVEIGVDFEQDGLVTTGAVGSATCKMMRVRDLVDFGTRWLLNKHPKG